MDFNLDAEQSALKESVDRFGARHYPSGERLRILATPGAADAHWQKMAELGWLGLMTPEAHGGLGAGEVDVMALMDGFGRHLMLEPYATRCVLAPTLLGAASEELRHSLLEGIVSGAARLAPAFAETEARYDLSYVSTTARPTENGFSLSGHKLHAEDGGDADWFIVSARTGGAVADGQGISLFLVHKDASRLRVERYRSIDHHHHARLHMDDVTVPASALVGKTGEALPLMEEAVDRTIAALLAEAVGSMDALRATVLSYLKTRVQFGAPIGSFQVLQHRMVDIDIACEEARSMMFHATLNLGGDAGTRRRAVSAAKARVGQCALYVGRQAVQLHGGLGMSSELIVSHHLKRLMMIDMAYGNVDHHKSRFARAA